MKRGQEEIVGFVAVMILIAIVFLVFLGISLRNPSQDIRVNSDVYYFLSSSVEVTSECALGFESNYISLSELFTACQSASECVGNKNSCSVLNSTMTGLIERAFNPGKDRPVQDYIFEARFQKNVSSSSQGELFLNLGGGSCTGSQTLRGATYTVPSSQGVISLKMTLCS